MKLNELFALFFIWEFKFDFELGRKPEQVFTYLN